MFLQNKDKTLSVTIDIPNTYKSICVNMSGGADSTILFFIIAKYIKDNNLDTKLSVATQNEKNKNYFMGQSVRKIIELVIKELNFKNFDTHFLYYSDAQSLERSDNFIEKMLNGNIIDLFIGGTTLPPITDKPAIIEDRDGNKIDIVDADNYKLTYNERLEKPVWNKNKTMYKPFVKVDKKFIADMYDLFGMRETLFPLTRSCVTLAGHRDYIDDNTHCGKCWWCYERKWAFGEF